MLHSEGDFGSGGHQMTFVRPFISLVSERDWSPAFLRGGLMLVSLSNKAAEALCRAVNGFGLKKKKVGSYSTFLLHRLKNKTKKKPTTNKPFKTRDIK